VAWVRKHYREPLSVERLAEDCAMSVSGLHHRFKAATAQSPVQFQKLLRLQEARRLLVQGTHDATTAAYEVGYQSLSHFTREYRRLFGVTPGRDGRRAPDFIT
jgi:AraC-like DNA-binding protein